MPTKHTSVRIRTPARLHFSLIDLNGELGRIDGGIGISLAKPNWLITISKSSSWSFPMEIEERLRIIQDNMKLTQKFHIKIESNLPKHVGLGSQTQLSLALTNAFSILETRQHTIPELAQFACRGGTSGIGVAAYENGGFILDGGHTCQEKPDFLPSHYSNAKSAVVINRFEVPADWYFVVTIPAFGEGKSGLEEVEIFKKYCPIPSSEVEKLSRIILMQMLPSIIEDDIEDFGRGLTSIQKIGFKRIENQLQDKFINSLQDFYLASGAAGTGLSSFGPATFGLIRTKAAAQDLLGKTEKFLDKHNISGTVFYSAVNNTGAEINIF